MANRPMTEKITSDWEHTYCSIPGLPAGGSNEEGFSAWIRALALPRTAIAGLVYVMAFTSFLSEDDLRC